MSPDPPRGERLWRSINSAASLAEKGHLLVLQNLLTTLNAEAYFGGTKWHYVIPVISPGLCTFSKSVLGGLTDGRVRGGDKLITRNVLVKSRRLRCLLLQARNVPNELITGMHSGQYNHSRCLQGDSTLSRPAFVLSSGPDRKSVV